MEYVAWTPKGGNKVNAKQQHKPVNEKFHAPLLLPFVGVLLSTINYFAIIVHDFFSQVRQLQQYWVEQLQRKTVIGAIKITRGARAYVAPGPRQGNVLLLSPSPPLNHQQ